MDINTNLPNLQSVMKDMDERYEMLKQARGELEGKRSEIDTQIDEINRMMQATDAYRGALGKTPTARRSAQPTGQSSTRPRRRGVRDGVLEVIERAGSNGIKRGAILEEMGAKGDKSREQSVSNALVNLKKKGAISHNETGEYLPK